MTGKGEVPMLTEKDDRWSWVGGADMETFAFGFWDGTSTQTLRVWIMLQRLIAYNLWNGWGYILYTYNILYTYMYLCMYILHIIESTYRSIADVLVSNLFDPPVLHTFAAARVNLCRLERLCAATQQRSSIPILRRSRSTKLGWLAGWSWGLWMLVKHLER